MARNRNVQETEELQCRKGFEPYQGLKQQAAGAGNGAVDSLCVCTRLVERKASGETGPRLSGSGGRGEAPARSFRLAPPRPRPEPPARGSPSSFRDTASVSR